MLHNNRMNSNKTTIINPSCLHYLLAMNTSSNNNGSSTTATTNFNANKQKKKRRNFTDIEDVNLTKSCVSISTDPVTGNGQKGNAFWDRIAEDFNKHSTPSPRSAQSLMNWWSSLHAKISKFCGHHADIMWLNPSGKMTEEIIHDALELYKEIDF